MPEPSDLAAYAQARPRRPEPSRAAPASRARYRTIWISDVHLGTCGCDAGLLLDFLDHIDSDTLYLVGDMIDGWRLRKRFYWPPLHNDVVRRLLKRARRGTRVISIPGNLDEVFRQFSGLDFGGVAIRRKAIHPCADGRRLLVLHGDEFDAITLAHRWLAGNRARRVPVGPVPDLSRDPPRLGVGRAGRRGDRRVRRRRDPPRHRRPAVPGGAALVPRARAAVHHRLSHAVSRPRAPFPDRALPRRALGRGAGGRLPLGGASAEQFLAALAPPAAHRHAA